MTDLATQPQADKASAQDDVEIDETAERAADAGAEGSPADDSSADAAETEHATATTDADAGDPTDAEPIEAEDDVEGVAESEDAADTADTEAGDDADAEANGSAEDTAEADAAAREDEAVESADPEADAVDAEAGDAAEAAATEDAGTLDAGTPSEDAEPATDATVGEDDDAAEAAAVVTDDSIDDDSTAAVTDDAATVAVATAVLSPAAEPAAVDDAPTAAPALPEIPEAAAATPPSGPDGSVYAWAEAEPTPRKKRTGLWLGIAAGVAVVGLVVSSLVLIAPGTTVAGVPVGWMTPGAAAGAIEQRLAETTVVLTGDGGDAELTGADLGASVDAQALADAAFAEHPMWNPTAWFAETGAEIRLDTAAATAALHDAAPELFTDPVDATVAYDADSASYVSTPATAGSGIDVATVQQALQSAFEAGKTRVSVDPVIIEVPATISTETAADTATKLNGVLSNVGFYVGDERTVPVDRAVAASWITVGPGTDGAIAVDVDQQKIQSVVDTLPGLVNREAVNATVVTNSAGKALPNPVSTGVEGRTLDSTDGLAATFADQLADGDGVFELPVTAAPFTTTTLARRIDVNLSTQQATLFENDQVVQSFVISSGAAGTGTPTGNFTIYAFTQITDMGALCYNPNAVGSYCTPDVPWVTWFYPDIAFHGASAFRSSLGYPQSHGCVNMWDDAAKFIYDWSRVGTEVSVHY
ncbi:L,D-transpeptidase family protein [Microbacterium sp. NEAU-LLC]|uniref:L,D-transpeptidase family protein n=1 Tax=Microbacterium helvum TaxID=2773713 RepID=A0ABR8NMG0_9MICO|nr:L,D-transpeptidase family protein [Microbacterium helvum]MBD3941829.1 L,D-transpeptidase family protein [Microbacterium helvum]